MPSPSPTPQLSGTLTEYEEHWLSRAIEDRLGEIIDRYRSQGKDVHNVGRLREKVAADINALRGTPHWAAMRNKYEPAPTNRVAWCAGCDKPLSSGSVTAWLEDKVGTIWCSQECKNDPKNKSMNLNEWKEIVKKRGYTKARRKEIINGAMVDGEEITLTWEEVKNFGGTYTPTTTQENNPNPDSAEEIEWD